MTAIASRSARSLRSVVCSFSATSRSRSSSVLAGPDLIFASGSACCWSGSACCWPWTTGLALWPVMVPTASSSPPVASTAMVRLMPNYQSWAFSTVHLLGLGRRRGMGFSVPARSPTSTQRGRRGLAPPDGDRPRGPPEPPAPDRIRPGPGLNADRGRQRRRGLGEHGCR